MSGESLRFVVLHHENIPEPHFDLMLELSPGSMLATWRCPRWPVETGMQVTPINDHRRDFLTYEGPLTGGRGTVRRIAAGEHAVLEDLPTVLIVRLEPDGAVLRLPRDIPAAVEVLPQ